MGGGGHGFSSSLHPDAVLPGSGDHFACPGWRNRRNDSFTASGNEDASPLGGFRLDLSGVLDHHGLVRVQHQRDGAALFQRG